MKNLLILLLLIIILTYCSPPRGRTGTNKYRGSARVIKKTNTGGDTTSLTTRTSIINYADTTIIEINPELAKYMSPIEREFDIVTSLFKDAKYEQACPKIDAFRETLPKDDSLRFEADFMNCECLVYQNKVNLAKSHLMELINNAKVTDIIKQKALVRLGQIYCYEDNKEKAELFFELLKKEFPNSKYLKVANCNAIKN